MRHLLDLLFPPRVDEVVVREISREKLISLMSPQKVETTRPATISLISFEDEHVRPVLHEAKYHGSRKALNLLAAVLSEYLLDAHIDFEKTRLVPVPLGNVRRKERGFNQAEEIANRAALTCTIKVEADILIRARETLSQVSLARRKRELNLLGAFKATRKVDPSLIYIVFDDTITTGATLQAAIEAMREAGAEHIVPMALSH